MEYEGTEMYAWMLAEKVLYQRYLDDKVKHKS